MAYDFCSVIPDWIGAVGWIFTIFPGSISTSGSGISPASTKVLGELESSNSSSFLDEKKLFVR